MELKIELLINTIEIDWPDISLLHPIAETDRKIKVNQHMLVPLDPEPPVDLQLLGQLAGRDDPCPVRDQPGLEQLARNSVDDGLVGAACHPVEQLVVALVPRHAQFRLR